MGLTEARVKIQGSKGAREISLVVDPGSEDTWIARSILEDIGIEPRLTRTYRTINNARIKREVGPVEVEYLGIRMPCPTVFAEQQDANVLGATALEILGLEVDPRTREIRPVEALAAYWQRGKPGSGFEIPRPLGGGPVYGSQKTMSGESLQTLDQ